MFREEHRYRAPENRLMRRLSKSKAKDVTEGVESFKMRSFIMVIK
jgi:hypothetical protein